VKVRTNLTPTELEHIGEKLQTLAKGQRDGSLSLENTAEKELVRRADHLFDTLLESLQSEIARVLLDKE
jgi:hypothetical protein